MLDAGLEGFRNDWAAQCKIIKIDKSGDPDAKIKPLHLTSGYRNPEHNDHVGSNSPRSKHQYGLALDIQNIDLDGDGEVIREKDGILMKDAAELAGAGYADWEDYNTITHADWRTK
ncbi:MAG: D-Ala-D-Ala carboxypeptidase family metallohydrolase [Candidatus Poribacteria bacterium]|nr:D-Ala-D-Ala carboxypeptidase family metallohydrolase [Candidatus Poribacteria bacterium]